VTAAETAPDADEVDELQDEVDELQDEVDELHAIVARQRAILTGVADALRGDPGPLASHGHHDLAERAASTVAALAVATRAIEAATTGERLTTCDELARLSREVATLRAAYASDLAGLRAEVRRADDERAAWRGLRDAARGVLAALEATAPGWDADESDHDEHAARMTQALDAVRAMLAGGGAAGDATMRRDLPAIAVVVCPACGVDITADLNDDARYITRRHSRREPARVGAGEIVWCDGGLAAP
jgi:septal ring factor EnvC (AmiA/AmiB activator)